MGVLRENRPVASRKEGRHAIYSLGAMQVMAIYHAGLEQLEEKE